MNSDVQEVNSLRRGLSILDLLLENGPMGVTELGRELGVNKSTAYRLVVTLQNCGYVVQDPHSQKYALGTAFLKFQEKLSARIDIRAVVRPYLEKLAQQTGENIHLCVLQGNIAVNIDQEIGENNVCVITKIGDISRLHSTAVGKVLLSRLPAQQQRALIASIDFKKNTPNTIENAEALEEELVAARANGYAVDDEEEAIGVRCVAAPILDNYGQAVAALGISGPSFRTNPIDFRRYIAYVTQAAREISKELGCNSID